MSFKEFLMGMEHAGENVKNFTSEQLVELFKVYEARKARLLVSADNQDAKENTNQVGASQEALVVKKTTINKGDSIKPVQSVVYDEQYETIVEDKYPEEQQIAFEQLKERISQRSDTIISARSTPIRVEIGIGSGKSAVLMRHDAVTCLAKLKRIEKAETERAANSMLIADELSNNKI